MKWPRRWAPGPNPPEREETNQVDQHESLAASQARTSGWLRQYAIRMPNGELYGNKPKPPPVPDYSIPSPMRDMYGTGSSTSTNWLADMLGMSTTPNAPSAAAVGPIIFNNHSAAKAKLDELRNAARAVGVTVYGGEIVERLCTPFSTGDLIAQFDADLQSWLQQNGGAS